MTCTTGRELREFLQLNRIALDELDEHSDDFLKIANEQHKANEDLLRHVVACKVCSMEETLAFTGEMMGGLEGDPPGMDQIVYPWNPAMEDIESEAV